MITRKQLIHKYLEFFKTKNHKVIPNSSLIPTNDPTVLFTTAGMHPLTPYLLGQKHPLGKRLVNVQKCVRTTDIDKVGDETHHTFFEMLGNWSLGDYWKKEAIEWSFEFLTKTLKILKEKINVTCFIGDKTLNIPRDFESEGIWKSLDINPKKIKFLGKEDNWWGPTGITGPCGPDTEIFVNGFEIWNNVFMEYNKTKIKAILIGDIDCLFDEERKVNNELLDILNLYNIKKILVTNIIKNDSKNQPLIKTIKESNIELFSLEGNSKKTSSDLFLKLLKKYQLKPNEIIYFDHLKDNLNSAKEAKITKINLYKNPKQIKKFIEDNLYYFESLKQKNVDTGMGVERTLAILNGLNDNYLTDVWLPIILVIENLSGKKYGKEKETTKAMRIIADHIKASVFIIADGILPSNTERGYVLRRLIRRAVRYGARFGLKDFINKVAEPIFEIYKDYPELKENKNKILEILKEEEKRFNKTLSNGLIIFEKMIKNKKTISGKDAFLLYQSYGFPLELTKEIADENKIKIDIQGFKQELKKHQDLSRTASAGIFKSGLADHSEKTIKLHTATHLLNESLRRVLGNEIKQMGSNITPERLRFDFNFPRKLTEVEITKVEALVNEKISRGLKVTREEVTLPEALKLGAQSEFGMKYPEIVSVYTIQDKSEKGGWFSKEICTGPHVKNTREIGKFKIIKEEAVAAGIRRIKAVVMD